ncbi:PEBP family protein [Cognatishimia sp. SS12]|uniref:PEBP family protein n=1 Tax=Cognatishimia sp. SS12 TaxID=2979465 RepID=UPI002330214A|nr:PEBP family protein [Cognatishimia sp. SS12]MDC0737900.1 PEBP family protein [Cognatishimia sp. SS12]
MTRKSFSKPLGFVLAGGLACAALSAAAEDITAEIWVDNWFALHVNGEKVGEDSVAYKTERSFNAETLRFQAALPMTVAVELRDFMENDTGLEYIGSRKQQMGDGGAILQFSANGKVIGASSADWKCEVIHHAPVQSACAKSSNPQIGVGACAGTISAAPAGWTEPGFDDSGWANAIEQSEQAVRPKDGYDRISWDDAAHLIWSADLERDNIVLCRATIGN